MKRLITNSNLRLFTKHEYAGMPILIMKDGMVQEYLAKLHTTIEDALHQHSRVFAVRFDLTFKVGTPESVVMGAITRFINALKYQIKAVSKVATPSGRMPHTTSFRYVWARERLTSGLPHYHILLLLNGNAIRAMGKYELGLDNLYNRVVWAWNSAMRIPNVTSYVTMAVGGEYILKRGQRYDSLFRAASYLCKVYSKLFTAHGDSFGSSRQ